MTTFTASVAILCCALITAALIKMLSPMGNTEKTLKNVIGIFVIICLFSSMRGVFSFLLESSELNNSLENSENTIDSIYNEKILSTTAQYMADYTQILLKNNDINSNNVKVKVEADDNMVINVKSVSIYIDKSDLELSDKITEIINNEFKILPKIIAEGN